MFYQIQLWKGLTTPYINAHQINKAEKFYGIWKWTTLLLLATLIIAGISAYLGVGNEQLSKRIYDPEFEAIKWLFAIGQVVQSLLVTAILIFFPALIFWVFTDIEYLKSVVIQLFVTGIYLIEKIIDLPLQLYFGLDFASSPFSLGIITQYLTDYELVINFFGEISLFAVWTIYLQFKYLHVLSERSPKFVLVIILSINLFLWIFTALFSYIKFEVLL